MFDALRRDERAIEGLPIRLVIALVVGVASLSVMMGILDDIDEIGETELDVQPDEDVIPPGDQTATVTVVDTRGEPVADATVVAKSGTARLDGLVTATTDAGGTAELEISPSLGSNQAEGTITLDVKPPDGSYVDRRENTNLLVIRP